MARLKRYRWHLAVLLLAGVAAYTTWCFPLPRLYDRMPPVDFAKLTGYRFGPALAMLAVYVFWFGLYLLAWQQSRRGNGPTEKLIIGGSLLWAAILAPAYPFAAIDIFVYALYSRMWLFHHLNPFIVPLNRAVGERWLPLAGEWTDTTTAYGPLWEAVAAIPAKLAGPGHFLYHIIGLKIVAWLLLAAVLLLLDHFLAALWPARHRAGLLLFAWNPLVLLVFSVDGHNDLLMLVFLLLAYGAAARERWFIASLSLWLSALAKFVPLFFWPFLFLLAWRREKNNVFRRRWLAWNAGLLLLWGGIIWWLIRDAPGQFALLHQNYATMSFAALLILLGRHFWPGAVIFTPVLHGLHLLFAAVYFWLFYRFWRGKMGLAAAWLAVLVALLFLFVGNFRPWYATWLLLLLPFCRGKGWRYGVVLLTFTALTATVYMWDMRYRLIGGVLVDYLVIIPYIFAVPALVGVRESWRARRHSGPGKTKASHSARL